MPGCCNKCKFKYSNETFGINEYICVNAKARNFRLHILGSYPDECWCREEKENEA